MSQVKDNDQGTPAQIELTECVQGDAHHTTFEPSDVTHSITRSEGDGGEADDDVEQKPEEGEEEGSNQNNEDTKTNESVATPAPVPRAKINTGLVLISHKLSQQRRECLYLIFDVVVSVVCLRRSRRSCCAWPSQCHVTTASWRKLPRSTAQTTGASYFCWQDACHTSFPTSSWRSARFIHFTSSHSFSFSS